MTCGGIVLCGGRSSRMGTPKAWLPFGDEFMLQRVVRIVSEAVNPVVVVVALGQDVPELPAGVRIVRDEQEGLGPLAGLAAGLAALGGEVEAAYLSSCDVPFLKVEFVRRVVSFLASGRREPAVSSFLVSNQQPAHAGRSPEIIVPRVADRLHPLAAAYRVSVLPHARDLLAAGHRRMTDLFDAVPTRIIEPHELADLTSLRNVNTPEEYEAALLNLRAPLESPSDL